MIPNEYLFFYYFASDTVGALRSGLESRGEFLLHQQAAFYGENGRTPEEALDAWRRTRREREETYFAEAHAAAEIEATDDAGRTSAATRVKRSPSSRRSRSTGGACMILDTANRSSLPFLDADAVVEVPCVVDRTGVRPIAVGDVPGHARALIESIKEVERLTIHAARTRSRDARAEGARIAPARALRQRREAYPRCLLRTPGRAGGAFLMNSTSCAPGPCSST